MNPIMQFFDDVKTRVSLAFIVVILAISGIMVLGITIIIVSNPATTERAQLVFNAVLPLFGTWVGTVLAYYFAQENLRSATSSTVQLSAISAQEKLNSVVVGDAMVPRHKMIVCDDTTKKLSDALVELEEKRYYPILSKDGTAVALIYREDILDFQTQGPALLPGVAVVNLTIQHLLDQKAPRNFTRPYAFVREDATLAAAKQGLDQLLDANLVFVTETGQANSPVVGMLTTKDIVSRAHTV